MKKLIAITAVTMMFLNAGCNTYWYQRDTTFDQCQKDVFECRKKLLEYSDLSYVEDYEVKFMECCMLQKGYGPVEEDKLPFNVKRQRPESSFNWQMYGISGTLNGQE